MLHLFHKISVWTNNYRMSCIDNISTCNEMERLIEWLPENIPPGPHPIAIGNYIVYYIYYNYILI